MEDESKSNQNGSVSFAGIGVSIEAGTFSSSNPPNSVSWTEGKAVYWRASCTDGDGNRHWNVKSLGVGQPNMALFNGTGTFTLDATSRIYDYVYNGETYKIIEPISVCAYSFHTNNIQVEAIYTDSEGNQTSSILGDDCEYFTGGVRTSTIGNAAGAPISVQIKITRK